MGTRARRVITLIAALLMLLASASAASAATTITVTSTTNSGPGSLRAAVASAATGDTIVLPAKAAHYAVTSEIPITVPLTIKGAGAASSVIDAGGATRVFHVTSAVPVTATVVLNGLTITGGHTTAAPGGAAIYVESGSLSLTGDALTHDTATLAAGSTQQEGGGAIYNGGADTTIASSTVSNNTATISGGGQDYGGGALFELGGAIAISDSTLSGNTVTFTGPDIGANTDPCCAGGGAVYQDSGATTTVTRSTLAANTVTVTSGGCCHGGAAIDINQSSSATGIQPPNLVIASSHLDRNMVTVTTSTLSFVPCCSGGGAVWTRDGVTATDSTFDANTASTANQACCNGGGAFNFDSNGQQETFKRSDLSANVVHITQSGLIAGKPTDTCCNGGGALQLDVGSPALTLAGSLVSGNKAQLSGSVVESGGGAIYADTSSGFTGNISNSTIAGNSTDAVAGASSNVAGQPNPAAQGGGAILNFGSGEESIALTQSTIAGNSAPAGNGGAVLSLVGAQTAVNSILARNSAAAPGSCASVPTRGKASATFASSGHNIEDHNSCSLNRPGDHVNTDPQLGALQNNGGPLETMALLDGSPAIGAADPASCPSADMRGVPRPQPAGGVCDIGAYEATAPTVQSTAATKVSSSTSRLNGMVNPANLMTSYHFEFGTSPAYGHHSRTITLAGGSYGARHVSAALSGLRAHTRYHFRLVASNLLGTVSSPDGTFLTLPEPSCTLKSTSSKVVVSGKGKLKKLRGLLSLSARCSVAVSAAVSGQLTETYKSKKHKHTKQFRLGPVKRSLSAARSTPIALKLPDAALSALAKGASESVSLTLVGTNAGGSGKASLTIARLRPRTH